MPTPEAVQNRIGHGPADLPAYIAGEAVAGRARSEVRYPYDGSISGTVPQLTSADLDRAIETALGGGPTLSSFRRYDILDRASRMLAERSEAFAHSIRLESGLCMRETRYEVGRACDVLRFAAMTAVREDGDVFSGDVSEFGKSRKIVSFREPVPLVAAITPFNHPLNQVAHKVAPAIAVGAPIVLKPSEKTPMTAIRFAELLYEAGLPGWMLSVVTGGIDEIAEPMVRDERVSLLTFTGGTAIGKRIPSKAGYKKLCLELGGNSPLIVLADADLDLAASLAAEGSYRNSGQRCTAVKRILVHRDVVEPFTQKLVEASRAYPAGDPADEETRVGTMISAEAASLLERRVRDAVAAGATVRHGGRRDGALLEPTVIAGVPREAEMVCRESFGPLAPVLTVRDLDDAIALANSSDFGLAAGVVTRDLEAAISVVRRLRTGTVNINQVPGYRIEASPFGGVKDSGLGIKEGVIEAARFMTTVKTFSLPW